MNSKSSEAPTSKKCHSENSDLKCNRPFSLEHFVFPYRSCDDTRRFDPLSCSLKRVHASMNMFACTMFNEQDKGSNLLSIIM